MHNDKITLKDLSFFPVDGSEGVFSLIDRTTTQAGREMLRKHVHNAPDTFARLEALQQVVRFWTKNADKWPKIITNGTLVMLDKFFEAADQTAAPPAGINMMLGAFLQKILNRREYFFTQFSISHLADFLRGCRELCALRDEIEVPLLLAAELDAIHTELEHRLTPQVLAVDKNTPYTQLATLNYQVRRDMKNTVQRLLLSYARLDAWQAMAKAGNEHGWNFPSLQQDAEARLQVVGLYHPLIPRATDYSIVFDSNHRLMVLTGANMSGKTTFMRALGVAALLAHLGMAVPARSMALGFLEGIITNMHVEDNILKGESYFLAEVLRMKDTATSLQRNGAHLVLMDELFKGTNVHDAYECTRAVIEGLLLHPAHLMILSTHLYEVANLFAERKEIIFNHFVTELADDGSYRFTYQLRSGISNDRIGYRILQREGVIALLRGTE